METNELKRVNVAPCSKQNYRSSSQNYRPVSVLSVISKIFEKMLCKQFTVFADQNFSKYQSNETVKAQCATFIGINVGEMEKCS